MMEGNFISLDSSDEGEQESLSNTIATIIGTSLIEDSSPVKEKDKSQSDGLVGPQESVLGELHGENGKGRLRSRLPHNVNTDQTSKRNQLVESVTRRVGGDLKTHKRYPSPNRDLEKSQQALFENEPTESVNNQSPTKQVGFSIKQERISLSPPPQCSSPSLNNEGSSPTQIERQDVSDIQRGTAMDQCVFVPEGWIFYCHKRLLGCQAGKFDQYYVAPGGKKLRSRVEVSKWIQSHKMNMDPMDFFVKTNDVTGLLKKGLLKYIDECHVTIASAAENNLEELREAIAQLNRKCRKRTNQSTANEASPEKAPKQKSDTVNIANDKSLSDVDLESDIQSDDSPNRPSLKTRSCNTKLTKNVGKKTPNKTQPKAQLLAEAEKPVTIKKKIPVKKSPYFYLNDGIPDKPISIYALRRQKDGKDTPPRSPFNLIQEDLFHDPWQMLTSTIFLNCTSGKMAIPLAMEFLARWPTPQEACRANFYDMLDVIEQLGLGRTRVAILIRFSHEFLTKNWKYPKELYGIGKYGNDSYRIFCMKDEWRRVDTDDPMLMMYLNWRRATEHLRKRFKKNPVDTNVIDPHDLPLDMQTLEAK